MDICTHRYRYKTATRIVIQKVGKPVSAATVSISLPCTPSVPSLPLLPTVRVALLHLTKHTARAVHPRSAALMCPLGSQLSLSWGPFQCLYTKQHSCPCLAPHVWSHFQALIGFWTPELITVWSMVLLSGLLCLIRISITWVLVWCLSPYMPRHLEHCLTCSRC